MRENAFGKSNVFGVLRQGNSRVHADSTPAYLRVRLHVTVQNIPARRSLDLDDELFEVSPMLGSESLLELCFSYQSREFFAAAALIGTLTRRGSPFNPLPTALEKISNRILIRLDEGLITSHNGHSRIHFFLCCDGIIP